MSNGKNNCEQEHPEGWTERYNAPTEQGEHGDNLDGDAEDEMDMLGYYLECECV